MSSEDSIESRQKNELEALQAIYGNDLKDLRQKKGAWNSWVPLHFSITLTPQRGSFGTQEFFVKIDLQIKCSSTYPNSVPEIELTNSKGLSKTLIVQLQNELYEKANNLKGEEMIFQLCLHVEEFLHCHNKPASKSFYEEMLQRQKEKELKDIEAKQLEQDRQRRSIAEEVQKRQEILKSESRLRKETRFNSENSNEDDLDYNRRNSIQHRRNNSSTESSDESLCEHKGTALIEFHNNGYREIQRGRCIAHSVPNHVVFTGIDKETGEIVIINEWSIDIENSDLMTIQRHVTSVEQEINYLTKLKHQNLAHYYNIKHEYNSESKKIVVNILKEFINGSNCTSLFLNENVTIDISFLKHIAKGVLTALEYLHRNNVVHKEVKDSCVYINDKGVVKVSNYSIHKRLSDLVSQTHTNHGKKTDIFNFGIFLLTLLQGSPVPDENVEIPKSVSSDLHDFLTRCIAPDEKERYTAAQLLNHSFFRKPTVHFSPAQKIEDYAYDGNISPQIIQNNVMTLSQPHPIGNSRITSEFEFLQYLGKGAFGDVIKVRNKLDGGHYAIKRIRLNPKNKQINKKIVREVKLLSRLNHENVVRYYNSWIETTTIKGDESEVNTSPELENIPKVVRKDEFTMNDDIEALAPSMKNVEVSITYESKSQAAFDSSSEDDSSEDGDWGGNLFLEDSDSDSIEFLPDSSQSLSKQSSQTTSVQNTESLDTSQECVVTQVDFMYIQMEFCEKSTLRTAIDDNLYLDDDRVWRLFREVVEGLAHIHQQGMIHRDLKPVNIFLDFEDHVKIGDFGLATTSMKPRNDDTITKSALESEKEDAVDESKTGLVGTALYVAPELGVASKAIYNQKVDIYSLGIILFEMCYKPLTTNMERIKILTGLRMKDIVLPEDFINKNQKQVFLIRWLLNHDTSKRPTSQELLQSEHVPPPVLEECELRELVRHTLSNPQLKGYKYLIASCFKQQVTPAQDITYDKDPSAPSTAKPLKLYDFVRQTTANVFRKHSGQNLSTPLLMPKSKHFEGTDSCVKLMTHFGSIVTLPHDLRVPFARYVAWNGITLFRRYSIERVYREKKVFGFIPRELYECAFDIVTPTPGNLMSDAEILYIVYELLNELPVLKNKHFTIRLNHSGLLDAILIHFGIKDKQEGVLKMMSEIKEGKVPKYHMQNFFITLGLSDNVITTLINLFNSEFEISKAANQFQMITKKKSGVASQLAREALQDLKTIAQNAEAFGITFDMVVSPGLVYNAQQYSGMICQFVCELKKKHKQTNMEVLAAGGRYDSMIASYRSIMEQACMQSRDVKQSAVGISISLDKLVLAIQKEQCEELDNINYIDAVLFSCGNKQLLKEKTKILRNAWAAGIRCFLIESASTEEVEEQCAELKVPHIIILRENEPGTIRVRTWDRDRFQEKPYGSSVFMDDMCRILKPCVISRSESKTNDRSENYHEGTNVGVLFITSEKLSGNSRKRYENQVRSQLDSVFERLNGNVIVLGLSLESTVVRTLASYLEFETKVKFQKSVESVLQKHQKIKKYLNDICDEIYVQKMKQKSPIIVLYSLSENFYKILF